MKNEAGRQGWRGSAGPTGQWVFSVQRDGVLSGLQPQAGHATCGFETRGGGTAIFAVRKLRHRVSCSRWTGLRGQMGVSPGGGACLHIHADFCPPVASMSTWGRCP